MENGVRGVGILLTWNLETHMATSKIKPIKVRIVWNGTAGELDSCTADEGAPAVDALCKMISGNFLNAGDSIVVEEVES